MKLNSSQYAVFNGLAFQIGWALCVAGGNLVAAITTVLLVTAHLSLIEQRRTEAVFLVCAGSIGFLFDLILFYTGILQDTNIFPPFWMLCLWLLFATTVGFSMRWFSGRLLLGGIFAGVFAPLSYSVGAGLSEVDLQHPAWLNLTVIGIAWAAIFPGLVTLRACIAGLARDGAVRPEISGAST